MRRRSILVTLVAVSLAGCNTVRTGKSKTETPTPTPSPSPTPEPIIDSVSYKEFGDPRGLNTIKFDIYYKNLNPDKEYSVWVILESDAGKSRASRKIQDLLGHRLGNTALGIKAADGTDLEGTTLSYTVKLRENGTVVDNRKGTLTYEEDVIGGDSDTDDYTRAKTVLFRPSPL